MDDRGAQDTAPGLTRLDALAGQAERFGERAERLGRLCALGLPVPEGVALDCAAVEAIAAGGPVPPLPADLGAFIALRASVLDRRWGGPQSILNLGITDATLPELAARIGRRGALEAYRRLIRGYGVRVGGLAPEEFDAQAGQQGADPPGEDELAASVEAAKALYAEETGEDFPQSLAAQVEGTARALAREWNAPSARILRQASGAGGDAGLALILQSMAFGLGGAHSGSGLYRPVDSDTGQARPTGYYLNGAQGPDAAAAPQARHAITAEGAEEGRLPAFEELEPEAFAALTKAGEAVARGLADAFELQFTVEDGALHLLGAEPVRRNARASVQIAVDLAESGAISRDMALLRVEPGTLIETLHPQIDPDASRDMFAAGLPASPGAATGRIYFTPEAAMAAYAQGEAAILVRVETTPEDIRGMHAAVAVLTVRGGMTSHAAVIARGLGLPCVVGASDLHLDRNAGELRAADGRVFHMGDTITVDGTSGEALAGAPAMLPAVPTAAFDTLMGWADARRRLGVRVNADTPADAALARRFHVDGIGLCRTEHMFYEGDRITVMREMILAETGAERVAALDRLLPMQRADFEELFEIMAGQPVTIRLLDPPLHEFLPSSEEEIAALAHAMDMPVEKVLERAEDLHEFNPMLGKRGVRLGITMPEIYDMQARAIFEAAIHANARGGAPVCPEIMIPLVSANREVELVKARVDAVAEAVQEELGAKVDYQIGVMVETPRGALRSGDLARSSGFLSFGTNDLTQMTYGLSRDDAGRFMRDYVAQGVFPEDPFHSLDLEGVGELLLLAARRGRAANPEITLGLCGEHGGDPESIRFCMVAGFDYVSCSPFRVPIARLAAAQAVILTDRAAAERDETL